MKKKIINILFIIVLFFILNICFSNISNAAIEIKPGTSTYWPSTHYQITADTAFMNCYNMRSPTSSLANNSLDPHMALNADYGAAVYLGASAYGDLRDTQGCTLQINGINVWSFTNNKTGVMDMNTYHTGTYDMGRKNLFTASILDDEKFELTENNDVKKIYQYKDTKYVEKLYNLDETIGMAAKETNGWYGTNNNFTNPKYKNVFNRVSYFSINLDARFNQSSPNTNNTYRPVIWN